MPPYAAASTSASDGGGLPPPSLHQQLYEMQSRLVNQGIGASGGGGMAQTNPAVTRASGLLSRPDAMASFENWSLDPTDSCTTPDQGRIQYPNFSQPLDAPIEPTPFPEHKSAADFKKRGEDGEEDDESKQGGYHRKSSSQNPSSNPGFPPRPPFS